MNSVNVVAPMPGKVVDIKVQVGAPVKAGDVMITFEAMKMELEVVAPEDGTVTAIHVAPGATFDTDHVMATLN